MSLTHRLLHRGRLALEWCRRVVPTRLTQWPLGSIPSHDEIYRAREGFARALEQLDSRRSPRTHGFYAATDVDLELVSWEEDGASNEEVLEQQLSDLQDWQIGHAKECLASDGERLVAEHHEADNVQWLSTENASDAEIMWEEDTPVDDASGLSTGVRGWTVNESTARLSVEHFEHLSSTDTIACGSKETLVRDCPLRNHATWQKDPFPPDVLTSDLTVIPNVSIVSPSFSTSFRGANGQSKPPWRRTIGGLQYGVALAGLMAPRTPAGADVGAQKQHTVQEVAVNTSTKLWRRRGLGNNHVLGSKSWSVKRLKLARRSERREESEMSDEFLTSDSVASVVPIISSRQPSVGTHASPYLHSRMDGVMRILSEQTDANLASHVFEWAKQQEWYVPDGRTYAELIRIMVWGGHIDLAEELLKEMEILGYVDEDTLMVMLGAYVREGAHDRTQGICKQMLDAGFITQNMYRAMVSLVADLEVMKRWRHVIEEVFVDGLLNRGVHAEDKAAATEDLEKEKSKDQCYGKDANQLDGGAQRVRDQSIFDGGKRFKRRGWWSQRGDTGA